MSEKNNAELYFAVSPPTQNVSIYNLILKQMQITKEQIRAALRDPYAGYSVLQQFSYNISGLSTYYNTYLDYLSGINTFDHYLYPTTEMDLSAYTTKAKAVAKLNIKSASYNIIYETLKYGETYWYPITSSSAGEGNKTIYQKIPSEYCRVSEKDNYGVLRYEINLHQIPADDMDNMPTEIQMAMQLPLNDSWYQVQGGFAFFAHSELRQHDYPYLAHIFVDLLAYEDDKAYYDEVQRNDNTKIIHSKIPMNDETKRPLLDKNQTKTYHDETKRHLPSNVSAIANPFDTTALSFDKNAENKSNIVKQSKDNIQDGAGISGLIFNSEKASALVLSQSMQKDSANMQKYLPELQNIFNWLLRNMNVKIGFVDSSKYNKDQKAKDAASSLTNGGSRLQYVAYKGLEPYEFLQLAEIEKSINVDELLPPKINANQMSTEDIGRPQIDETSLTDEGANTREKA